MNALQQLDRLRREAVERARASQRDAKRAFEQSEGALREAVRQDLAAERQLQRAYADFAASASVLDLRAAELQLSEARRRQRLQRELRGRCERAHEAAAQALGLHERALLEAELGRRAVERRLTQQAADVGRRTEQKREDEAEDAFRASRVRGSLA